MKRHGLWRFHFEAKAVRERFTSYAVRWWIEDERERVIRLIDSIHAGYGGRWTYSNADAIVVCAKRYMRRYGGVRTVGQWNELVKRIARRAGYDHHTTIKAASLHYAHRDKSPIYFHDLDFGCARTGRPYARFSISQIEDRRYLISLARQRRELKEREEELAKRGALIEAMWEAKAAVKAINDAINAAKTAMKERA